MVVRPGRRHFGRRFFRVTPRDQVDRGGYEGGGLLLRQLLRLGIAGRLGRHNRGRSSSCTCAVPVSELHYYF